MSDFYGVKHILIESCRETVANGAGCHRVCETDPNEEGYCGCREDAKEVIDRTLVAVEALLNDYTHFHLTHREVIEKFKRA